MKKRQKQRERHIERGRRALVVNIATWKEEDTQSKEAREREIRAEKDIQEGGDIKSEQEREWVACAQQGGGPEMPIAKAYDHDMTNTGLGSQNV